MSHRQKSIFTLFLLLASVFLAYRFLQSPLEVSREPGLFINETQNHAYDRSLKLSVKTAQKRSGIENSVILLERRPNIQSIEELAVDLFQCRASAGSIQNIVQEISIGCTHTR